MSGLATTYRDVPRTTAGSGWNLDWDYSGTLVSASVIQLLIVAVATFLVLVVVAIGLSLAATESRDERDVLVAVGREADDAAPDGRGQGRRADTDGTCARRADGADPGAGDLGTRRRCPS
ncbi:MAG: hypothetical protein WKF58_11300 [Ilumatobacteraceae bacterium]